ncbi:Rv3654c family TadE-like protein [Streptomyces sp. KL2]|uniref:Rv3654c family TadE-like protein n=1 Tax=Streptomyces sp. KL2 TaxID=3050126 RepID=UPI00397E0799
MRNRGDRLPPRGGVRPAERGSATVWAALCGLVLCTVAAGVLALGQAVVTRHRAGAAADAAALAAADHALRGAEEACAAARRVAAAQRARVVRCRVREEIADLTVRVRAGPYSAGVRARAGPAAAAP